MEAVQLYAWQRIGDPPEAETHEAIDIYQAARLLNFTCVKQHELSPEDIEPLDRFPLVDADVIETLVGEKDEYHILLVTLTPDTICGNSGRTMPRWYAVAKDIALIQPSSAFM